MNRHLDFKNVIVMQRIAKPLLLTDPMQEIIVSFQFNLLS